jgi:integrase
MEEIKQYIFHKRETLSKSSVNTYASILKSLFKKVFGDEKVEMSKFDEVEKVLEHLKNLPSNKRKTILSALVIITDKKPYRDLMLEDVKDYNHQIAKQEKTPAQEESWVSTNDVKEIYEALKKNAELLYKKKSYTSQDLQEIQSFIIMSLLGGIFVPPRRSKDIVDWKIKNIDKSKDNYLEKNKIYYNSYKTSKFYGEQQVEIPKELKSILTKWIKINPTDYLLFDKNMNQLSSIKLNQRLNKIFGKKVGVNQMRHTYLTNEFGHTIEQKKKIDTITSEMGTSPNMLINYVKNDD